MRPFDDIDMLFSGLGKLSKNLTKAARAAGRLAGRTAAAAFRFWLALWAWKSWLAGAASVRSLAAKVAVLEGEVSLGELAGAVGWTAANAAACYYYLASLNAPDAETSVSFGST